MTLLHPYVNEESSLLTMIVSAWILTHYGRTSQDAIEEVRNARRGAIENVNQEFWVELKSGLAEPMS